MAEVLITLAVIGVVAALTIPNLIHSYKTQANIVKLKKVYSLMNQAIRLSEADNGPIDNWMIDCSSSSAPSCSYSEVKEWFEKYLGEYIKTVKIEEEKGNDDSSYSKMLVYLPDGIILRFLLNIHDVRVILPGSDKSYAFILNGDCDYILRQKDRWKNCGKYFDTYCYGWDGTREGLFDGKMEEHYYATAKSQGHYCLKLLQYDGWTVKKDNPCKYY